MATKIGAFIKNVKLCKLWPKVQCIDQSSLCKRRQKVSWKLFDWLVTQAVTMAYSVWEDQDWHSWHGMSVYAIDGSLYNLPASKENRKEFDPKSGLHSKNNGKGHYPQCMVNTVYDVFRRLPIARVVDHVDSSERSQAVSLLPKIPENGIIVADRGYPGYEFFLTLLQNYKGYFLVRGSSKLSFLNVKKFIQSDKDEAIISIPPTQFYLDNCSRRQKKKAKPIQLRVIRCLNPQGEVSVLFTNLLDMKEFPKQEIINLYNKRWEVESFYRDEKVYLEIVKFHSTKPNEIRQELFAVVVMSVLTRVLIMLSNESYDSDRIRPRFKNAILALSNEAALLLPHNPVKAFSIFLELIEEMKRVKHYGHKKKRKNQPRVCKRAINKWSRNRRSKILKCCKGKP